MQGYGKYQYLAVGLLPENSCFPKFGDLVPFGSSKPLSKFFLIVLQPTR